MVEKNGRTLTAPIRSADLETSLAVGVANSQAVGDVNPIDILHAWRRRWLLCVPIGIAVAAIVTVIAWIAQGPSYEAEAYLRLSATGTELVFDQDAAKGKFEVFQGTQRELAKTRFVMIAALRDPEIAKLSIIQKEKQPIEWLMDRIRIVTPKDTEIMRVSLRTESPEASVDLVNGMVRAYEKEVITFEHALRQQRLDEVSRIFTEKEGDLRRKRGKLKELAQQLGSGDTAMLSTKLRLLVQELGGLRSQLVHVQGELWRAQGELAAAKSLEESLSMVDEDNPRPVSPGELEVALASDLIYRQLLTDKMNAHRMQLEAEAAFKDSVPDLASKIREAADFQLQARSKTIEEQLHTMQPLRNSATVAELQSQVQLLQVLERQFKSEVERLNDEIETVGNQSIDVEMMRDDMEQLESVLASIAQEREQLRVELRSRPRVEVRRWASADDTVLVNRMTRPVLAGLAGMVAFLVPVSLILLQDLRTKTVNCSNDVSRELEVIGTVPLIPSNAIRRQSEKGDGGKVLAYWQSLLGDSVDRIATSLLVDAHDDGPSLMLVTSAIAGEGKTTLSTQLAMSLARAGRTVTLVDIDLRRPMVHKALGLDSSPGICEVLRGEAELTATVQSTAFENLSAISAGHCDSAALRKLSHEGTASFFKELRGLSEFVIIDGCPVLPLADTGFICPHVDTVLFAVRRDLSRMDQVRSAQEFISKCGNQVRGAVVTEGSARLYRDDRKYTANDPSLS